MTGSVTAQAGDHGVRSLGVALQAPALDADAAILLVGFLTAAVGAFVAYQALRGYLRNDSRPMLFLGLGIAFLTAVPFAVVRLSQWLAPATGARLLLAVTLCNVVGLAAILYSLTRA